MCKRLVRKKERWGRLNWALLVPFANLCAAETIGSHTSSSQKKIPCRTINIPPSETSPCFWSLSSDKEDKKVFFIAPGPLSGMNYLVMPNLWYAQRIRIFLVFIFRHQHDQTLMLSQSSLFTYSFDPWSSFAYFTLLSVCQCHHRPSLQLRGTTFHCPTMF